MNAPAPPPIPARMTVEQFHAWLDARAAQLAYDEPKWELFSGVPEMQSSEQWIHGRVKVQVWLAFRDAIARSGLPLEAALDSIGVAIGANEEYVPELVVFPAGEIADHDRQAPDPLIVVEVLSPSSRAKDLNTKVAGYGRVPTIRHYLVFDPQSREIIHVERVADALVRREPSITSGMLRLDPPGLEIDVGACFG